MILIVGATGTNGRMVLDGLAKAGVRARALVRNPTKATGLAQPNVEIVAGDLDDPHSLASALAGVDRAFFVAAVDPRLPQWFRTFLEAAQQAGTEHILKFSAMCAEVNSPVELLRQHGETDQLLKDSGLKFTILQPNSFYQNMLWSIDAIKSTGSFYVPMGNARQSLVDVRDIAHVAVAALTTPGHEGKTYEITGPEAISYHDVAAVLSRVLEKPVNYVDVPLEAARQGMIQAGSPPWNANAVAELLGYFAQGHGERTTDIIQKITGTQPITFEQFARDHAGAFRS